MDHEPDCDPLDPCSTEFITATAHLYRAEISRMLRWRQRLDITSNWAIILATGITTFTLGDSDVPHYTLLLGLGIIFISLLLEARRYRHLHHSKWRLFLLESGFFASVINPGGRKSTVPDWRRLLSADLRHTHFSLSWYKAIRLRLRRNYLLVVYFVTAVWLVKLFIHPHRPRHFAEFFERLTVGGFIPSWLVAVSALIFILGATYLSLSSPPAEVLEDWSVHYQQRRARLESLESDGE
jgi:uncharacterized membrane protein